MGSVYQHAEENKAKNQRGFSLPQRHGSNYRTGESESGLCEQRMERRKGKEEPEGRGRAAVFSVTAAPKWQQREN